MKDIPISQTPQTPCVKPASAKPASAATSKTQSSSSTSEPSLEFRALIERLRDQARTLEQSAEKPLNARELPGAVQAAQASLHDALSIADSLVEAYRSSLVQGKSTPETRAR